MTCGFLIQLVFSIKICLLHQSVTPFLRGAPPPRKNPWPVSFYTFLFGWLLSNGKLVAKTRIFQLSCLATFLFVLVFEIVQDWTLDVTKFAKITEFCKSASTIAKITKITKFYKAINEKWRGNEKERRGSPRRNSEIFIYLPISREDKGERKGIPHTHPIP